MFLANALAGQPAAAELAWEPGFFGQYALAPRPWAPGPPPGVKVPKGAAHFLTIRLAGTTDFHVAFDAGFRLAWGDRDTDGDLSEEQPLRVVPKQGVTLTVDLPPACGVWLSPTSTGVKVATKLYRHGSVVLAGRVRRIKLIDGNGDLLFNDAGHDLVYLDVGGDGFLDRKLPSAERLALERPFHLGGRGYEVHVIDPLGSRIEVRPVADTPAPVPLYFETLPRVSRWKRFPKEALSPTVYAQRYKSAKPSERKAALHGAAHVGDKAAAVFLEHAAESDPDDDVQQYAAKMMACLLPRFARVPARLVLEHADPNVRRYAAYALHRMNAPKRLKTYAALLEKFPNPKWTVLWKHTLKLTAMLGTKASRRVLLKLYKTLKPFKGTRAGDFERRNELYDWATHADPAGPPRALLEAALKDPADGLRSQGLIDLWIMRDPLAGLAAKKELRRRKLEFRLEEAAIRVVASEPDAEGLKLIVRRLEGASARLYGRAVRLVRGVRDPGALEVLRRAAGHRSSRVRTFVAEILGGIPSSENAAVLTAALKSERDEQVRSAQAEALGDMGDRVAIPVLLALARRGSAAAASALARLAPSDPAATALFATLLASKRWTDRVVALRALGGAAPATALAENAAHKEWPVRAAAVAGLRARREKESVDVLVARLGVERVVRIQWGLASALYGLTGKDIGIDSASWAAWWRAKRATFVLLAKEPSAAAAKGGTVARFFGLPVQSDRVCFVIDASGSMADKDGDVSRFDTAKAQVRDALERMAAAAQVNVVFFDDEVRAWRKSLTPLTPANRKSLAKYIDDRAVGDRTNLFDALRLALSRGGVDTVFVLSDGAPTVGEFQGRRDVLRAIRRLNRTRNIAIHGVAIGVDSTLLRLLAEEHGGKYVRR